MEMGADWSDATAETGGGRACASCAASTTAAAGLAAARFITGQSVVFSPLEREKLERKKSNTTKNTTVEYNPEIRPAPIRRRDRNLTGRLKRDECVMTVTVMTHESDDVTV